MSPEHSTVTHVVDGVAAFVAVATIVNLLPAAAALFTLVWTAMRIWEMLYGCPFSHSRFAKWITGRA